MDIMIGGSLTIDPLEWIPRQLVAEMVVDRFTD
jgi:hypothetical protein